MKREPIVVNSCEGCEVVRCSKCERPAKFFFHIKTQGYRFISIPLCLNHLATCFYKKHPRFFSELKSEDFIKNKVKKEALKNAREYFRSHQCDN